MRITRFAFLLAFLAVPSFAVTYRTETVDLGQLKDRLANLGTSRLISVVPSVTHLKHWCPPPPAEAGCHLQPDGQTICIDPWTVEPCVDFQVLDSVVIVTEEP